MSYMARHVSHGVMDALWNGTTYCVEPAKLLESLQTTADDWNAHLQSVVDASQGARGRTEGSAVDRLHEEESYTLQERGGVRDFDALLHRS